MELTDRRLRKVSQDITDADIASDTIVRALRATIVSVTAEHKVAIEAARPLHAVPRDLPQKIDEAQIELDALLAKGDDIAADIVCGSSPQRLSQQHDTKISEARDRVARLAVARPVIERRLATAQQPVGSNANRMQSAQSQLETAIERAKLNVACSRLVEAA